MPETAKEKLKIAHVVEGFTGGLATYMENFLPKLTEKGHHVSLICSLERCCADAEEKLHLLRSNNISVHVIKMKRGFTPFYDIISFLTLIRLFLKNRYDVVHTHCSKAGLVGRLAGYFLNLNMIIHSAHCFAFQRMGGKFTRALYLQIEKLLAKITNGFVAVSQDEMDISFRHKIYGLKKCFLVNNGLKINKTLKKNKVDRKCKFLLSASRLVNYKRQKLLIDTIAKTKSNCHLVIAGQGKQRVLLEEYTSSKKLESRVHLYGYCDDISGLLQQVDLAILCSTAEGQPYFILEAFNANTPVIGTDVCGTRGLLCNGRGLLVSDDSNEIAKKIDFLLCHEQCSSEMTSRAKEYLVHDHDIERQSERLANVYEMIFNEKQIQVKHYYNEIEYGKV